MLVFRLFFCSEAYVNASRCASRWAGPDLRQLSRSEAYVRPSRCASPYSIEYRFSAPPAIPSPVERKIPDPSPSARSTAFKTTPLSGKVRLAVPPFAQRDPAFWWTTLPVQHTCPPQHPFWWTNTHSYLPSSPRSASQSPVVRFAAVYPGFGTVFLQRSPPNVSVIGFAVGCAWFSVISMQRSAYHDSGVSFAVRLQRVITIDATTGYIRVMAAGM